MNNSSYVPTTLNDSLWGGKRGVGRSIRKRSSMQPITYPVLRDAMKKLLEETLPGNFRQSMSNLNTALNQYLGDLAIPADAVVGVEFRTSYYKLTDRHLANLRLAGRSEQSIRDRKSLLKKWRAFFVQMDKEQSASDRTQSPFLDALLEALPKGVSLRLLAEQTGIPRGTLNRWRAGVLPRAQSVPALRRLERYLALAPGHLTDFVVTYSRVKSDLAPACPNIPYREALKKHHASPYRLTAASDLLKSQWAEFLQYKTTQLPFDLLRTERGRWNPSPLHPGATVVAKKWFAVTSDGQYVPSASIAWGLVTAFLGWLIKHGGQPEAVQTLALFTDLGLIHKYLGWYLERSGGRANGGHVRFTQFVLMLTHPRTGYLTQKPEFRLSLGDDVSQKQWAKKCLAVYTKIKDQNKALKRAEQKSRNPNSPVAAVIQLQNPMLALQDMRHRIRAGRPTAGTFTEAIWGRDLLLVDLLMCSPLRAKNLKHLTYRADGTGSLRRKHDGSWELLIPPGHFKNHDGAAAEREYRVELDTGINSDIEAYLKIFRPMLLKGRATATDLLFVSTRKGYQNDPWGGLNRHVESLTARFLMQCPGVGPQAIRHIIATAIVKSTGEYTTAALVLHDKEDTIKKNYAHLCSEDGHTRYRKLFPEIFK